MHGGCGSGGKRSSGGGGRPCASRPVGSYDSVVGYAMSRSCPYIWGAEGDSLTAPVVGVPPGGRICRTRRGGRSRASYRFPGASGRRAVALRSRRYRGECRRLALRGSTFNAYVATDPLSWAQFTRCSSKASYDHGLPPFFLPTVGSRGTMRIFAEARQRAAARSLRHAPKRKLGIPSARFHRNRRRARRRALAALTFLDYDAVPVGSFCWIHWLGATSRRTRRSFPRASASGELAQGSNSDWSPLASSLPTAHHIVIPA